MLHGLVRNIASRILVAVSILGGHVAFGDVVTLKNGSTLEGVITAERPDAIQLEERGIKLWIKRSKITSVNQSGAAERKKLLLALEQSPRPKKDPVPQEAAHLRPLAEKINYLRTQKDQKSKELKARRNDEVRLTENILRYTDTLLSMMDGIEAATPSKEKNRFGSYDRGYNKSIKEYNQLVMEHDEVVRQREVNEQRLILVRREISKYTDEVNGLHGQMEGAQDTFSSAWTEFLTAYPEEELARGAWFDELSAMGKVTREAHVPASSQGIQVKRTAGGSKVTVRSDSRGHFHIPVALNQREGVSLLFDTGASTTIIPAEVAEKAGLKPIGEPFQVTAADGRKVTARRSVVKQFMVCGVPYADEQVAILEKGGEGEVEGLLGLSFINKISFGVENQILRMTLE